MKRPRTVTSLVLTHVGFKVYNVARCMCCGVGEPATRPLLRHVCPSLPDMMQMGGPPDLRIVADGQGYFDIYAEAHWKRVWAQSEHHT